jgi:hypothetical protein
LRSERAQTFRIHGQAQSPRLTARPLRVSTRRMIARFGPAPPTGLAMVMANQAPSGSLEKVKVSAEVQTARRMKA